MSMDKQVWVLLSVNLMKNVLVIGCSHVECTYTKNNEFESERSWAWHLWNIRGRREKFYVVPHPGAGIMQYANTLQFLNSQNLLDNIDSCIIQLTGEPRTIFPDTSINSFYDNLSNFFNNDNGYNRFVPNQPIHRVITNKTIEMYYQYENNFVLQKNKESMLDIFEQISNSMANTNFAENLYPIYYSFCINLLKQKNIDVNVFSFWNFLMANQLRSIKTVSSTEFVLHSLEQIARTRNVWHEEDISNPGLHHNEKSNQRLATILHEYINLD